MRGSEVRGGETSSANATMPREPVQCNGVVGQGEVVEIEEVGGQKMNIVLQLAVIEGFQSRERVRVDDDVVICDGSGMIEKLWCCESGSKSSNS